MRATKKIAKVQLVRVASCANSWEEWWKLLDVLIHFYVFNCFPLYFRFHMSLIRNNKMGLERACPANLDNLLVNSIDRRILFADFHTDVICYSILLKNSSHFQQ